MDNEKKITLKLDVKGLEKFKEAQDALKKGIGGTDKVFNEFATKTLPKTNKAMKSWVALTKRATFYRVIGLAFRAISSAVKEGTKNLYEYSKAMKELGVGSDKRSMAYETLNSYASLFLMLKNSIGAALAPAIQALLPIVETVTNAFINLLNAVNQLFSLLSGKSVGDNYTAATKANAEFLESSVGSAKELKKTLLGFDELNVLNSPSSGGGGSSAIDYSKYFQELPIMDKYFDLALTIKDVFFNWKDITMEQFLEKLIVGITTISGGLFGKAVGGSTGALIGATIGAGIGLSLVSATFDHDGQVSKEEILPLLRIALGGLVGGVFGFAIGQSMPAALAGAQLGVLVTAGAELDLNSLFFKEGQVLSSDIANSLLIVGLGGLVGGAIGFKLGKNTHAALAGAAIGMIVTAGVLVQLNSLKTQKGGEISIADLVGDLAATLTLMSGANAGFKFGSLAGKAAGAAGAGFAFGGAVVGLTVAAGLILVIESIKTGFTGESKRQLDDVGIKPEDLTRRVEILSNYNKSDLQPRAAGGMVTPGSMFLAGERGAELITATSNGVNVSTRDQIAASVASGNESVVNALFAVANTLVNTINSQDYGSDVYIGDRDIVRAYDRGKRLMGNSLVEV